MEPMKQCPNCGKYVPADKTYCMSCGTTLGVKCPSCGKVVPVHSKTCPCGHSFVKKAKKKAPSKVLTVLDDHASGFEVMGYFLGGHPQSIETVLGLRMFNEIATPITLLLYGEGLGYLVMLVGLVLAVLLGFVNMKKLGKTTSKRLLPVHGVVLGGSAVVFLTDLVIRILMNQAVKTIYTPTEAGQAMTRGWQVGSVFPILVFVLGVLLFGVHLTLHLLSIKDRVAEGEVSLSDILKTPFTLLGKLFRKLRKKSRQGKRKDLDQDERSVVCTKRFTIYLILLGVSLVFTQALLSKISHIFFWFMLLLPLPMLLYALVAKHALTVTMISESATTEKNAPYTYEFDIENHSPLAFPFIDAHLSIPQANSVRCTERVVHLAMAPLSTYHMKNTVSFRFRGTYDIGVKYFYVYDFFRMFRIRVPVSYLTSVYVLPRRLSLDDLLAQAVADSTVRTVSSPLIFDRLEVSDIRDYRMGDSLKSIHWKLSSKSEEFVVKEHNTGTSDQTVIFCDMAAHYPDEPPKGDETPVITEEILMTAKEKRQARKEKRRADKEARREERRVSQRGGRIAQTADTHDISDEDLERRLKERQNAVQRTEDSQNRVVYTQEVEVQEGDTSAVDVHRLLRPEHYEDMNEYLADGVVELAIASVLAELHMGHEVTLIWYDRRSESGIYAYVLKGIEAFENIYHLFATAPLTEGKNHVTNLTAMISEVQSAKQMFVVSAMDAEMLTKLMHLPGVTDAGSLGSAEVMLYNPDDRFAYATERFAYLDGCREQLSGVGLTLRVSGMIAVRQEEGEQTATNESTQVSADGEVYA